MDGIGLVMSSSRGRYSLNIGRRSPDRIVHERALSPAVFENTSTDRPMRKPSVRVQLTGVVTGNDIMKYMNTSGIAMPNSHIWLKIVTWASTSTTKSSRKLKNVFAILISGGSLLFDLTYVVYIVVLYESYGREAGEVGK